MKLVKEINIMNNKKIVILLNIFAVLLFFPFLYLFAVLYAVLRGVNEFSFFSEEILGVLIAFVFILSIHELIHGLFFKLFQPNRAVKFGIKWKSLMAYATSPGSYYKRGQMVIIGLAPFVLISLVLSALAMLGWPSTGFYVLLASVHAASCVGDFYYVYLLLWKYRKINILTEDTETGLRIYQV